MSMIDMNKEYDFPSVLERFYLWEKEHGNRPFLHQPKDGVIESYTWGQVATLARKLAQSLTECNFEQDAKIGILSKNCAQWFICDLAIMLSGHISVPIFYTAGKDTISYICEHADIKLMFVGKLDDAEQQIKAIPADIKTVAFPYENICVDLQWLEFINGTLFKDSPVPAKSNIATIIYTSGSTGQPKGVVHTYGSINWSAMEASKVLGYGLKDRMLSYLPLAHITERVYVEFASYYSGKQVWFVEQLSTFQRDIQACQPTVFFSVPRLWTKFQIGVLAKLSQSILSLLLKLPIINNVVKNKVKAELGFDKVRIFGSGSAPLSPSIIEWFNHLNIAISEGWGMTENCAYGTTCIPFNAQKVGAIGTIHPGIDLRISSEGEIQVKGPCNMLEYYKDPKNTTNVFTNDGYFCTGDKGAIDSDGYVKITGRLKDMFKTSKGKYVTPAPIESSFMANSDIEQVCVTGSSLPQPIALIVLTEDARLRPISEIDSRLLTQLSTINQHLESHQRLDRVIVCKEPWTTENNILTPTLKVRRHILEKELNDVINTSYQDKVVRL